MAKTEKVKKYNIKSIILIIAFLFCIFMSIKYLVNGLLSKNISLSVSSTPNINYKVHLKQNVYYEDNVLDPGMKYVASLIDYIDTDISYTIKSSVLMDYDYSYYIDATARVYGDNAKTSVLFEKTNLLLPEKKLQSYNTDNIVIKENLKIDYNEYNKLIASFKTSYDITALSDVSVVLHVKAKGKNKSFEKAVTIDDNKSKIVVPLTEQTVNIEITKNDNSNIYSGSNEEEKTIKKNKDLIIAVIFIIITAVLLLRIMNMFNLNQTNAKLEYKKSLKKILKEYDLIIANVENPVDEKKYEVINISSFTELKDVHDNIGTPILFYEEKKNQKSIFVLVKDQLLYKYVLKTEEPKKTKVAKEKKVKSKK